MMSSGGYTHIDNQNDVSGSVPAVSGSDHVSVKFAESNLQTFPPSEAQGKISAVFRPPSDADDTFSKPAVNGSSSRGEAQPSGWMRLFTVAAYRPYFDVDTSDVLERIKDSLVPFKASFTEKTQDKPDLAGGSTVIIDGIPRRKGRRSREFLNVIVDLSTKASGEDWDLIIRYGPFWICTTLIFVAAAIGTFVTYLAHKLQHKEWDYDINLVTWSAGLFYGYVTFVPVGLYLILKYFSAPSGLAQLWCLYGYSLFVFIPASCLSVVPVEIFRWVIAGIAGFMSATFVALNLRMHIKSAGEQWILIVAGIFLLQLGLAVILKLYFFTITVGKE